MYLRKLRIQRLKLIRDLELDFTDLDGKSIRKWTVIIGQNGTGKSSILQAAALAAAGGLQVNTLAGRTIGHLRDRRSDLPLRIGADFEFTGDEGSSALHPLLDGALPSLLNLRSEVKLDAGETTIQATAAYAHAPHSKRDPLDVARARNTPRWFVAGYGVARFMPDTGRSVALDRPAIERMLPLFDPMTALTSTGFARYFSENKEKASRFDRVLKRALLHARDLLPNILDFELRAGNVSKPGDLLEQDRFSQVVGTDKTLKIPGVALAHGYQSTIAWLADLVGHVLLEADMEIEPEQMEGVVLVDEIDLYLHPVWQATLIPALRATFSALQFIVTTHSPVVLSGVAPHEEVRLQSWGDTGDVIEVVRHPDTGDLVPAGHLRDRGLRLDARMMTGSEIFREHFGLAGSTPNPMGDELRKYTMLASDPFRTDEEHQEMLSLRAKLGEAKITHLAEPVRRRRS